MTLSRDTPIQQSPQAVFTPLDDELLALDVARSQLYSLNETGGLVWDALAQPTTVAMVCDRLVATFEVDRAACERDVLSLVSALCEAGLVEVVGDGP